MRPGQAAGPQAGRMKFNDRMAWLPVPAGLEG